MENYKYTEYDAIIRDTILFMQTKIDSSTMTLTNFNIKDENCVCIYYIAAVFHTVFNYSIKLDLNWFNYLIFCMKYKCFNFIKRGKNELSVNCKELIDTQTKQDIYKDIYNTYYKR